MFRVRLEIHLLLAPLDLVKGGLSDINVAIFEKGFHLAVEEGQ